MTSREPSNAQTHRRKHLETATKLAYSTLEAANAEPKLFDEKETVELNGAAAKVSWGAAAFQAMGLPGAGLVGLVSNTAALSGEQEDSLLPAWAGVSLGTASFMNALGLTGVAGWTVAGQVVSLFTGSTALAMGGHHDLESRGESQKRISELQKTLESGQTEVEVQAYRLDPLAGPTADGQVKVPVARELELEKSRSREKLAKGLQKIGGATALACVGTAALMGLPIFTTAVVGATIFQASRGLGKLIQSVGDGRLFEAKKQAIDQGEAALLRSPTGEWVERPNDFSQRIVKRLLRESEAQRLGGKASLVGAVALGSALACGLSTGFGVALCLASVVAAGVDICARDTAGDPAPTRWLPVSKDWDDERYDNKVHETISHLQPVGLRTSKACQKYRSVMLGYTLGLMWSNPDQRMETFQAERRQVISALRGALHKEAPAEKAEEHFQAFLKADARLMAELGRPVRAEIDGSGFEASLNQSRAVGYELLEEGLDPIGARALYPLTLPFLGESHDYASEELETAHQVFENHRRRSQLGLRVPEFERDLLLQNRIDPGEAEGLWWRALDLQQPEVLAEVTAKAEVGDRDSQRLLAMHRIYPATPAQPEST